MAKNCTLPNQDELHTCMSVLDQIGVNRTDAVEVISYGLKKVVKLN